MWRHVRIWTGLPLRLTLAGLHTILLSLTGLSWLEQTVVRAHNYLFGKNGRWHDSYDIEHWPEWLR